MAGVTAWFWLTVRNAMKPISAVLLVAISFSVLMPALGADAFRQNERLGRGVNIIGWDSLWQDRARGNFKDEHFKLIHQAGFSHVRINLHPLRDGQPNPQGQLRKEFFATLDWAVDQALANQLLVVLDFHDDLVISPDPAGKRGDFLESWTAIAEHCQGRPPEVLFEILNEPAPKFTHESWSDYWHEALAIIRKSNPTRTVVIGPDPWNSFKQLESLHLPEDDQNLIVTFHYYDPFAFTHQGTPGRGKRIKPGSLGWEPKRSVRPSRGTLPRSRPGRSCAIDPSTWGSSVLTSGVTWIHASAGQPSLPVRPRSRAGVGRIGNSLEISCSSTWPAKSGCSPFAMR